MTDTPVTPTTTTPAAPAPFLAKFLQGMTAQQMMGLGVAIAASIALLVGLFMWGQTPDYKVLYSNLSDQDGGAIIQSLQQQNIPYKFTEGGGSLLVPGNLVHEVRLRLASQGLPKGGSVGFEIMEAQKFGTSQFLEQVNYQRSLEGELARSMQTLSAVQSARIHLAIPKPTVFVKEQQKPTASVVLTLHPGRALDLGQVNGIIHLVSSSIPNMPPSSVTVLDQSGNMLSAQVNKDPTMDATQLKYVREIEQDYIKRIEAILAPITGQQNVRAQVTASIDFSQVEQTAETFKPNQAPNTAAVRSTQSMESQNGLNSTGGVPGALSNQPPTAATAPITRPTTAQGANAQAAAAAATTTTPVSSRKEATSNYEVDRTIQHTKLPVGSIRRLSVAVVMNNRNVTDPKSGKVSSNPYTDAEKAQITALVRDAMGFDARRGDSLNVLNSAFNNEVEAQPEIPLWKQPEMIALAKDGLKYLLIAGAVGFLLLGIIRPAFRNLAAQAAAQAQAEADAAAAAAAAAAAHHHGHHAAGQYEQEAAMTTYEENLQLAKELTKSDPKIVASVVKEWVNQE